MERRGREEGKERKGTRGGINSASERRRAEGLKQVPGGKVWGVLERREREGKKRTSTHY